MPDKCQCLYWFAMKNKKVSQSINFYNYKAKEPSVWTIEGQMKQLKKKKGFKASTLEYQNTIELNNNEEEVEIITEQVRSSVENSSEDDDVSTTSNRTAIHIAESSVLSTPPPIIIRVPVES